MQNRAAVIDIDFDEKSPPQKFSQLRDLQPSASMLSVPLIALHGANEAIADSFGVELIYLFSDQTVESILRLASVDQSHLTASSLPALSLAQVIYRFTVAKKFGLNDGRLKQLRINSWGRELVKDSLLPEYADEHRRIYTSVTQLFQARKSEYSDLIALLTKPITPESAKAISSLNAQLAIKVLS